MARPARRSKRRTIEVDFTDVEVGGGGGFHIPEGEYGMIVESVKTGTSSNDNEQLEWIFKGTEGKAKGKSFYFYTPLVEQALWKLRQTLEALGVEVPDSAMDIDLDELEGLECVGNVVDDEYKGKERSKLDSLSDGEASNEGEAEPRGRRGDSKKKTKVSEDEVKDMDADELETLVEKYNLDIDLSKFKTDRKKQTAVIAELEEQELLEA